MGLSFVLRRLTVVALLAGLGGCRKSTPPAPAAAPGAPATIEVLKDGRWLFTYAEPAGTFATTDKPDSVPEPARNLVRVFDPSATDKADGAGRVYVTDLNEVMSKGKAQAKVMTREAFETAALAAFPTGASSPLAAQRMQPAPIPADGTGGGGAGAPAQGATAPVVTVYGTSWCGACRAARQYLTERKIPFADKDIEKDAEAARELAAKASKMGIPTDRVPVLDVRGRLLLGFDKARVEALLGGAT
jgi:glutaredoxin